MGQVYQATSDTKLNRQVALKILPEAFAADFDRLASVPARSSSPGESEWHTGIVHDPCVDSKKPTAS